MTTTMDGIGGGLITPPPSFGGSNPEPQQIMENTPKNDSKLELLVEAHNTGGGVTRVSSMNAFGGKLIVYEHSTVQMVGGLPRHNVTASSVCFIPGSQISESIKSSLKKR